MIVQLLTPIVSIFPRDGIKGDCYGKRKISWNPLRQAGSLIQGTCRKIYLSFPNKNQENAILDVLKSEMR
jgi:hypothetical protein